MVRNVGSADRVARIVVGLGIIAAGLYLGSWWGAVGLIPLITAAVGSLKSDTARQAASTSRILLKESSFP